MTEELKDEIVRLIVKRHPHLKRYDINENDLILEDLELDDLDFIELVMDLEEHFCIEITDEEWYNVSRVEQIFKLVNNKL